jgi:hypothetical protein
MKLVRQIPILLTLEHVQVDSTRNNIIAILLKCIAKYGKKLDEDFGSRWVCNGYDQHFFLWRIFATWRQKKRLANLTKEILGF